MPAAPAEVPVLRHPLPHTAAAAAAAGRCADAGKCLRGPCGEQSSSGPVPATPQEPTPLPPRSSLCCLKGAYRPDPQVWAHLPKSPGPSQPHSALSRLAGHPACLTGSCGAMPQTCPCAALSTWSTLATASPLPPEQAVPNPCQGSSASPQWTEADPSCHLKRFCAAQLATQSQISGTCVAGFTPK